MVVVGVKDGIVELCVSVEDTLLLAQMYPEYKLLEKAGDEDIGWAFNGVSFTAPVGG